MDEQNKREAEGRLLAYFEDLLRENPDAKTFNLAIGSYNPDWGTWYLAPRAELEYYVELIKKGIAACVNSVPA